MFIIIKYVLKNLSEKKFRTFLILISISLASSLFFASRSLSVTMADMYAKLMMKYTGSSDIIIHSNRNSPSAFVSMTNFKDFPDIEYSIPVMNGNGFLRNNKRDSVKLNIWGMDIDDLMLFNPVNITEEKNLYPFSGDKVIINTVFSKNYNKKSGDILAIEINNTIYRFRVAAVAESSGIFRQGEGSETVIIPLAKLSGIYGVRNRYSSIYIKLFDNADLKKNIKDLSVRYSRYAVRESISRAELEQYLNQITIPFLLMTIMVFFISAFIIYSSFKVITIERLPIIGTFRSIGAAKSVTDLILSLESFIYGLLGGLIGIVFGFIILYVMSYIMAYDHWSGVRYDFDVMFKVSDLIMSVLSAVLLTFFSSIIPVMRVSKFSVKDIVLNNTDTAVKKRSYKFFIAVFLIASSLIIPQLRLPSSVSLIINVLCILIMSFGVVIIMPFVTDNVVFVLKNIFELIFGNEGLIAVKNLRENKSILNNITLLAIGISGVLMINTVSFSVSREVMDLYSKANFDIMLWTPEASRNTRALIHAVGGVKESYGSYSTWGIEVVSRNDRLGELEGLSLGYESYWNEGITSEMIKKLSEERNIIISYMLKEKFRVNAGDKLRLKMPSGEKEYKIIGFNQTVRNNGNWAAVSDKYLKLDTKNAFYDTILIRTSSDPDAVVNALKNRFSRRYLWIATMKDMQESNEKSNNQLFIILKGFSILTMIIGVFGIMNNFIINFIERRRHIAVMRSVGMSRFQVLKMIFIESAAGGIIGGVSGVLSGIMLIMIITEVMKNISLFIPMHYSVSLFVISAVSGVVITASASLVPALKARKINIIEAIKYE